MLYLIPLIVLIFHYYIWLWKRLEVLRNKVKNIQRKHTIEHEIYFVSTIRNIKENPDINSNLGLYKNQPEFQSLVKNRVQYFTALSELREQQRAMFLWEDIDMDIMDEDDHETWNIKMDYRFGPNKKNFFSYLPEYFDYLWRTTRKP